MPDPDAVRLRAYELSQSPDSGTPEENWLRAEHELGVVHEYDTADRDLESAGMTVWRFPLEAGVLWLLRLPRGEFVEAWEAGTDGLSPPPEIAGLLDTVAAGKELEPAAPVSDDSGATRLREMFETQRRSLIAHDPGTRLGADPENLHQHRVAARRTRAFLRATRDYTDEGWRASLEQPLRELAGSTGPVRDLDVLIEHVAEEVAGLDEAERTAGQRLLHRLDGEREGARRALVAALDAESYRSLLVRLRPPPRLGQGVREVPLAKIAKKEFRRLIRTLEDLGKHPDDHALHRLRIKLKRARYASELAAPGGAKGKAFLADAKTLQTLLGEHQDAAVAEERLRQLALGLDGAAAFVAGRLAERQRSRRVTVREQLPSAWKRLRKSGRRLH
jgi:CHAD domain-containing protein